MKCVSTVLMKCVSNVRMKCVSELTYAMCIRTYIWNVYQSVLMKNVSLYQGELWTSIPPLYTYDRVMYKQCICASLSSDLALWPCCPGSLGIRKYFLGHLGSETVVSPRSVRPLVASSTILFVSRACFGRGLPSRLTEHKSQTEILPRPLCDSSHA